MIIELTDINHRPTAIHSDQIGSVRTTLDGKATMIFPKNGPAIMVMDAADKVIAAWKGEKG